MAPPPRPRAPDPPCHPRPDPRPDPLSGPRRRHPGLRPLLSTGLPSPRHPSARSQGGAHRCRPPAHDPSNPAAPPAGPGDPSWWAVPSLGDSHPRVVAPVQRLPLPGPSGLAPRPPSGRAPVHLERQAAAPAARPVAAPLLSSMANPSGGMDPVRPQLLENLLEPELPPGLAGPRACASPWLLGSSCSCRSPLADPPHRHQGGQIGLLKGQKRKEIRL